MLFITHFYIYQTKKHSEKRTYLSLLVKFPHFCNFTIIIDTYQLIQIF